MSTEVAEGAVAEAEEQSVSLLEQAITATKQTERGETEDLLSNLTEQVLQGTVTWDRNLTQTIKKAVAAIDQAMSKQLSAILHDEKTAKAGRLLAWPASPGDEQRNRSDPENSYVESEQA